MTFKNVLKIPIAPIYFSVLNLRFHAEQTAVLSSLLTIITVLSFFSPNLLLQLFFVILYISWAVALVYYGAIPGTGVRTSIGYPHTLEPLQFPKPKKNLELLVFQTGTIETGSWGVYEGPSKPIVMDEAAFLIRHPKHGDILFETGIHPNVAHDPVEYVGPLLYFGGFLKMKQHKNQDVISQLHKHHIKIEGIKTVFVSHLHPEHCGAVELFPHAQIVVDKKEHDYAVHQPKYNYFKKEYKEVKKWKLLDFSNAHKFKPFHGIVDWFEDGSIYIISSPGHTPGHISMLLNLPAGPVFLVGDIIWKQENLTTQTIGMPFVSVDGLEHRKALGQLTAFVETNPNILIVPSHDLRNVRNPTRNDIKILG